MKLFECVGQGRPVVATKISEQIKVHIDINAGFCVPFEETAFAEAII